MSEDAALEDRVERLETGQNRILSKLDELLGGSHEKAQEHQERHLDRPSSVAEMVQRELAAKEARDKEKADKDSEASEREQIKAQLAKLAEQPPAQPQPRREKMMWGPR